MATPSSVATESGAMQHTSPSPAASASDADTMDDIPRRPMRVKVLYTFDDQNKSNCLARLPSVVSVPVVSLDETTQVGVIELKTCIQAIVTASPELVAKLGHDYTVYAYDFSEYETPLVGQGMLSWILASASSTPNAPAEDSNTMVTGRVCKNILGLFNNGVKETLEVKLKLVPVPTCMQKEYVENLERYHSLSQIMPEGLDYTAWSDFLKENPTLGQLAKPKPEAPAPQPQRHPMGGYEPFHQMLTRQSPSQDVARNDSFHDHSHHSQTSRASSPAMSTVSLQHYQYNPNHYNPHSRPNSRASTRSEAPLRTHDFQPGPHYVIEEQEDGPPKKRARIIQAKRPRHTPLTAHNDSLRVTASTAASVRLHRPIATNSASALASTELLPRAPTPRPGEIFGSRGPRRPPAPSTLRQGSVDTARPYMSPYDTYSDNAMDSVDETSPTGTPLDIPSSPPVVNQRTVSPGPSSPPLPVLSNQADSGFVSDMPLDREEEAVDQRNRMWEGSDLPTAPEVRCRPQQDRSHHAWKEVIPGPLELLPQSYVPPARSFSRAPLAKPIAQSIEQNMDSSRRANVDSAKDKTSCLSQPIQERMNGDMIVMNMQQGSNPPARHATVESYSCPPEQHQSRYPSQSAGKAGSPDSMMSHASPGSESEANVYSRSATPNPPLQQSKTSRGKLTRSYTCGEPMSDALGPSDAPLPRSGSHAKRKKHIRDKLQSALIAGDMPDHCNNCGEIDTPTWRKIYTRIEMGSPDDIELTPAGIVAYEVITPPEGSDEQKYRVYKNKLTHDEKNFRLYESLNLCNPCGLWLIKKGHSRPQRVWEKSKPPAKRKRSQTSRAKSEGQDDNLASDAAVPQSESTKTSEHCGVALEAVPQIRRDRAMSFQSNHSSQKEPNVAAQLALQRAIQSSPVGVRGSKDSPIDIDTDLTPKPTRRILFPSPRKEGETKSLTQSQPQPQTKTIQTKPTAPVIPPGSIYNDAPEKPRCERCKKLRRGCDRERPCGRCEDAGIGHDGCIPCEPRRTYWFEPTVRPPVNHEENGVDKENCPPPPIEADDDLAHLFEEGTPSKTTPQKGQAFQDLLKTPTPGSRHRVPLTPKQGGDLASLFTTPSRTALTPRGTRNPTTASETPFTRQLNAILSDCLQSSPSQALHFSNFPSYNSDTNFDDFLNDEFLSSDVPVSSSPPKVGTLDLGFDLYEDPNTATGGLWEDQALFSNDAVMLDMDNRDRRGSVDTTDSAENAALLRMNVGGITVDFAAMIDNVIGGTTNGGNGEDEDVKHVSLSPEAEAALVGPEAQADADNEAEAGIASQTAQRQTSVIPSAE